MKKPLLLLLLLVAFCCRATAQPSLERSVVASAGGSWFDGSSFRLDYTLGEFAVLTMSNASNVLTQGFQQPFGNAVVFTPQATVEELNISVFPNPAVEQFSLRIENAAGLNLQCVIMDMLGQIVLNPREFFVYDQAVVMDFDISSLATGNYFIRISSGNRMLKTGKLIKINQ